MKRLLLTSCALITIAACSTVPAPGDPSAAAGASTYKLCPTGQQIKKTASCPNPPSFAAAPAAALETAGTVSVVITKSGATTSPSIITYFTDGGTAVPGTNYKGTWGTTTVPANVTTAVIKIPLLDDHKIDPTLTFNLKLKAVSNAIIIENSLVSIIDADNPAPVQVSITCADGTVVPTLTDCTISTPTPTQTTQTCPNGSIISSSSPCPAPTPNTTPESTPTANEPITSPNGLNGETSVADNFTTANSYSPTTYPAGVGGGTPPISADPVGAFRFVCLAGPVLRDDPVVLPGQPGKSHLHQFTGNTGINGNSTYNSLRTTGGTKCGTSSAPANRSGYWIAAMLDGAGNVVLPDYFQVYYKQIPESSPTCQGDPDATHIGHCVNLPNGIRYVTGYNMATGQGGPTSTGWDQYNMYYQCWSSLDGKSISPTGKQFKTIADVVAAGCPIGAQLVIIGVNPSCWDGINLDVADHRSHMTNEIGPLVASIGFRSCPADHPYVIPSLQIQYHYTVDTNFEAGKWHLSSDDAAAQMLGHPIIAGTTLHFDYFEAWSPTIKAIWENCINGHLTCGGGDLGNGTALISGDFPPGGPPIHQLIPIP